MELDKYGRLEKKAMTTTHTIILPLIVGIALGCLFFGGLWLTVKKAVGLKYAALWVSASSLLRTAVVLAGFYFVAVGNWQKLLICVLGFIAARFIIMWLTKYYDHKQLLNKADPS
jgi:F1F0 ATPase subunit 2